MRRDELERLIRTHQQAIYRYVRCLGAEPVVADDVVQETFLAANRKAAAFTDDGHARAVLRGMARNLFLTECRRDRRQARLAQQLALVEDDPKAIELLDGLDVWAERIEALRDCVKSLPEPQASLIQQRYVNGTPRAQMAQQAGMSEDGIKSSLRRIRTALARCIESKLEVSRR